MIIKEFMVYNNDDSFNKNFEHIVIAYNTYRDNEEVYVMWIDVSWKIEYRENGIYIDDKFLEDRKRYIIKNEEDLRKYKKLPWNVKEYICVYYINKNTIAADNDYLKLKMMGNYLFEDMSYEEWVVKGLVE